MLVGDVVVVMVMLGVGRSRAPVMTTIWGTSRAPMGSLWFTGGHGYS